MKDHYIIVAGGTGGHIVPAVVFGNWLEQKLKAEEVNYVTGTRPLEKELFSFYGKQCITLPLKGSPRGISGAGSFKRWIDLFLSTVYVFLRCAVQRPKACILFGGYICLPFILAAKILAIPTVMHEQNTVAGKTTRLGARFSFPVCTGWKTCEGLKTPKTKTCYSGIPVRFFQRLHVLDAWNKLDGNVSFPEGRIVLVFGGSLGSASLVTLARRLAKSKNSASCFFLVVCGEKLLCETKKLSGFENVLCVPPSWDTSALYSLADVVLCRGGASTLAELLAYGIPGVVVPLKNATESHQKKNAQAFQFLKGGVFWEEGEPVKDLEDKILGFEVQKKRPNSYGLGNDTSCQKIFETVCTVCAKGEAPQ